MKNGTLAVLFVVALTGSASAKKVTHNFVKVGELSLPPNPVHVRNGEVGQFDAFLDLGTVLRDSGVTVATVEARRVGGEGQASRTETTILIVCNRGTYSLDHADFFDAKGAKFHTWRNPTYDRTIPEPDTMMSAVFDLVCPRN